MAKASTQQQKGRSAPPPSKSKAVTTKTSSEVDSAAQDELAKMMAADAGKGVSTAIEDNVVPLIYILQPLSPQVQKKKVESYIEGAEAGNIWFRGTKDLVSGDDGIPVVPCYFSKCWIEWLPERGGFVARHENKPEEAVLKTDAENPKKKFWAMPNGNLVVETREHVVLVLDVFDRPLPFVIPMSGSGHSASRNWMSMMGRKTVPGGDMRAPSFGYIYRMKTQFRSNDQGDWFTWLIEDEGNEPTAVSDPAIYRMARQIEADFSKGTLRAGQMEADQVDDGDNGSSGAGGGGKAAEHI